MSAHDSTAPTRTRRAAPITKHTARNGAVSYWFQADVGAKPDGTRDRRRFTYRTLAEARMEWHRVTAEVAAGTYAKVTTLTVDQACDQWLAGRRGLRRVTLEGYRNDLKAVRRHLGGKKLQQITKGDGDGLVEWMLTSGRQSPRHYRPESLAGRVTALVAARPDGITSRELSAALPAEDVHTCLSGLIRAGRVTRPRRAVYVLAPEPAGGAPDDELGGVGVVSVRSTLTRFTAVVQSFVDQGLLPRNVIALVERPKHGHDQDHQDQQHRPDQQNRPGRTERTAKSWTVAEVQQFREAVRDHRLYACWLSSMYGLRRSEVLGLRWRDVGGDTLQIRQGRVAVGIEAVEGAPKSRRSRRDLPMPAELVEALRSLKTRQRAEAFALGVTWSEDRLVAVHADAQPVRPEWFSDEFHRLRAVAGLRRIHLKGLRNTSVSLMLDQHHPVHVVAAWHGHDPAVSLSIYSDAKADELRAASTALFG